MRIENKSSLSEELLLPCGQTLKNRIAKSAMSDGLGSGRGTPTPQQVHLYRTWAGGGLALSIIGEVQGNPAAAEKPGNLVLTPNMDLAPFKELAKAGSENSAQLWVQLGHAGAMSHPPISQPKGPSALDIEGLQCAALSQEDIAALPAEFARTAQIAKSVGFGGVQVHAAHGFLLSQFLSPLFNQRTDGYGGSIENRMRLTLEVIDAVRQAVGSHYPVSIKLNATDQLSGGLAEDDALEVMRALQRTSIDLIDISGGTYFPGAPSASDATGKGPYFFNFAKRARSVTSKPLMLTGGFKTYEQVIEARDAGIDMIGLARALVLEPGLPNQWLSGDRAAPDFPRFAAPPEGGLTAWYTMRLSEIAAGRRTAGPESLHEAIAAYDARDAAKAKLWNQHFGATAGA